MKSKNPTIVLVDDNVLLKSLTLEPKDYLIGRASECDFILNGKEVSRKHARVKFKNGSYVIEDLASANGTFVNGKRISSMVLKHGDEIMIGDFTIIFDDGKSPERITDETQLLSSGEETKSLVVHYESLTKKLREREVAEEFKEYHHKVLRSRKKLTRLANQDRLTGLYNRRYFDKAIANYLAEAQVSHAPLSLIFIDIDHFKKINDTYGHDKGDEVLKVIAQFIRSALRQEDIIARYGGEEFVVLFSHMTSDNAFVAAESLRRIVEETSSDALGFKITISIGVATYLVHAKTCEGLIREADRALYRAKSSGRNCVVKSNA